MEQVKVSAKLAIMPKRTFEDKDKLLLVDAKGDLMEAVEEKDWTQDEKCQCCDKDIRKKFSCHHCRKCGKSVCGDCSKSKIGDKRVCDECIKEYLLIENWYSDKQYIMKLEKETTMKDVSCYIKDRCVEDRTIPVYYTNKEANNEYIVGILFPQLIEDNVEYTDMEEVSAIKYVGGKCLQFWLDYTVFAIKIDKATQQQQQQQQQDVNGNANANADVDEKKGYNDYDNDPQTRDQSNSVIDSIPVCEYLLMTKDKNIKHCPIYLSMIKNNQFSQSNLFHMQSFDHSTMVEEFSDCKDDKKCASYQRSLSRGGGYSIHDQCHMSIYKHSSRIPLRLEKLANNFNYFTYFNESEKFIASKHMSQFNDNNNNKDKDKIRRYTKENKTQVPIIELELLIEEVIKNGYKKDLLLDNYGKHRDKVANQYGILKIVQEKMLHPRHVEMGMPLLGNFAEMLALVLHTCCDCSYSLHLSQRLRMENIKRLINSSNNKMNKFNKKWDQFEARLNNAIRQIHNSEIKYYAYVYSCINDSNIKFDDLLEEEEEILQKSDDTKDSLGIKKRINFSTFVNTSRNENIAKEFMGNNYKSGMIIRFEPSSVVYLPCCDVSWISKFPNEEEVLFSTIQIDINDTTAILVNQISSLQYIHLETNRKGQEESKLYY